MATKAPVQGPGFTDLAEFRTLDAQPSAARGNIIKAHRVCIAGKQKIGIIESGNDQPTVLVHKDGDVVTGAEFLCTCGRRATIEFEYDEK